MISKDEKRFKANQRSAQFLGYTLLLGEMETTNPKTGEKERGPISEDDIDIKVVQKTVYEKLTRPYEPRIEMVFLHLPEDYNHHHRFVSQGSLSACRGVKNVFYFAGPGAMPHLRPQVFVPFGEEEMRKKMEAVRILREAYGPTRYFSPEHNEGLAAFWGQWIFEFVERSKESKVNLFGKDQLPYAEVFQVERLRLCFDEGKTTLF